MLVTDLKGRQRQGERFLIELRVGARAGHRPYVDHQSDARLAQEIDKFDDRPGRVAYREKGARDVSPGAARARLVRAAIDRKRPMPETKARVYRKILRFQGTDSECGSWCSRRSGKLHSVRDVPRCSSLVASD